LDEQEGGRHLGVLGARLDELAVALGLGLEDALRALGLGGVLREDGVGLALRLDAPLLGLGGGGDLDAPLLDLLWGDLLLRETRELAVALGEEDGLLAPGHRDVGAALCVGGDLAQLRLRLGHEGAAGVLAGHGGGLGLGDADALLLLGLLASGDGLGLALGG